MKLIVSTGVLLTLAQLCTAQTQQMQQATATEELQIAIRRFMQCQADNVSSYNDQMRLVIEKNEKLLTELNKAKQELVKEKNKTKVTE